MPYQANQDLPKSITDHLPEHAQTIFRKTFNSAHEQYNNEETAFRVAWAAVKKEYEKNAQGIWVKKP
ncbi:cation transporter [candidate division TM6 bacterium RIFCSPHIGHO2_12_FULL_38_8]|nr:MAG: cation transporter [candidate division TM6 bacterium RIFCSPHIGHO2_12_FULL_38_8]